MTISAQFNGFTLEINDTTGRGRVKKGTHSAHAKWDGFNLECPAIPRLVVFELEVAMLGGLTEVVAV